MLTMTNYLIRRNRNCNVKLTFYGTKLRNCLTQTVHMTTDHKEHAHSICNYCRKPGHVAPAYFKRNRDERASFYDSSNNYSSNSTRNQCIPNHSLRQQQHNQHAKYFPRNDITCIKPSPNVSVVSSTSYKNKYQKNSNLNNNIHTVLINPNDEFPQYLKAEIDGLPIYMLVDTGAAISCINLSSQYLRKYPELMKTKSKQNSIFG